MRVDRADWCKIIRSWPGSCPPVYQDTRTRTVLRTEDVVPGEEDSSTTSSSSASPGCPDVDRHQAGDLPQPADHQEEAEQPRAQLGEARHVLVSALHYSLIRGGAGRVIRLTADWTRCDPNIYDCQHMITLGSPQF